jgi:hypothetical protein
MPKKPNPQIVQAAKKVLDPKEVLTVILNQPECEDLKNALIREGLVEEVKEKKYE